MSVLDRATLEASSLADLHAIASELSVDGYRRLRKDDLIDALVAHQEGRTGTDEPDADAETGAEESGEGATKRRRGRRGGRGRGAAGRDADGDTEAGAEAESESEGGAEPEARPSRRRSESRGKSESRARADGRSKADGRPKADDRAKEEEAREEPETVEGVVELLPGGSGFVRLSPPEPSDEDVYISAAQVKRCELVSGDRISGPRRAPHRSERYPSLIRIDTVNGKPASEIADGARFDDLPCALPKDRFKLGSEDPTLKAIEFLTPFGRGSRITITGGRWAGKSHALRSLAEALLEQKDVTVLTALAGVRPEEIADWAASPAAPKAAVSFAASSEAQDHAVELVVDQARRLAARGEHAIVLIDSLDGLQPLSARRALAAARNITDGGSLTVIATASEPLGGETTVVTLDPALTSLGKFPAVDLAHSGTMRAELLVGKTGANAIAKERTKALK